MKSNRILFFLLSIYTGVVFSQKRHCKAPVMEDLMTITKCAVEVKEKKGKKNNNISVRVLGRRSRMVKKNKQAAVALGYNSNKDVANVGGKNEIPKLSKTELVRTLSKKISAEEIAKSVPLSAIRDIPLFPKCLNNKSEKKMDCFAKELSKHIQNHLRYPSEAVKDKIEGDVWVRFIINKKGNITNIEARGPKGGGSLELEAKTVIANLPKFKPGVLNGKNINVKYAFPINFKLDETE